MPEPEQGDSMRLWERAVPIISFAFIVIGGIWFAGGQWQEMKTSVNALRTDVGDVKLAIAEIKTEQSSVRVELATAKSDAAQAAAKPAKRTPVFRTDDRSTVQ